MRRTEAGNAFAPESFEAHFVGCVAKIVVFVWDAPYERRLESCALFDNLLDLGGREETFLAEVLQLGEHLGTRLSIHGTHRRGGEAHLLLLELYPLHDRWLQ